MKKGVEADKTARINARLLDQYKGQTIRLTAKIIKLNGETATVEASDGGQVSLLSSSFFSPILSRSPSSSFLLYLSSKNMQSICPLISSDHTQDRADIRSDFI